MVVIDREVRVLELLALVEGQHKPPVELFIFPRPDRNISQNLSEAQNLTE